jgi:AraC-like DNA-binding protein
MPQQNQTLPAILLTCYATRSREGEQFAPGHILSYQIAGELILNDGVERMHRPGDLRFVRRNSLVKFTKIPPANGQFESLSVNFDQQTLRDFSREYGYISQGHQNGDTQIELRPQPFLKSYMESLLPYVKAAENEAVLRLKVKEAILLLLKSNPELKDILFDFSEPGKIDLEAFMNQNFHFNVKLSRFAYLTGRSLATFKRDFERIFNMSPSRWLQQRRLKEAHYLIAQKGKSPSDVYLDLGFEDLSHFSFAFKKFYGVAPSRIPV